VDPCLRLGLELPPIYAAAIADPLRGSPLAAWLDAVDAAEQAGYGAVWVVGEPDQAALGGTGAHPACDPCTLAGALAPLTTSLTLGVVSGVGKRDRLPSVLARDVTALDVLSSGRSALLLQLGPLSSPLQTTVRVRRSEPNSGNQTVEERDRLAEAAEVCRLLFTEDAPTFIGRHFRLVEAANCPRPVRTGGPLLLVQAPLFQAERPSGSGSEPGSDPGPGPELGLAWGLTAVDAWVVTGGPAEIAALHGVADRPALIWRGSLPPGADAARAMAALVEAGVDGLIVALGPPGEAPGRDLVEAGARSLAGQWGH